MHDYSDIPGYEGSYQINQIGQVKSLDRATKNHRGPYIRKGKKIIACKDSCGYLSVGLSRDNKCKTFRVHTIMAKIWLPNEEGKEEVNHKDGDKNNNNINNLEWVTKSENMIHAYDNGLKMDKSGINNPISDINKNIHPHGIGQDSYNSKIIIDLEYGIYYFGAKEAAASRGISHHVLYQKLNGLRKNNTQFIYA